MSEAKTLTALEEENRRLKRIAADQALNRAALKDVLGKDGERVVTAEHRRTVVAYVRAQAAAVETPISERPACRWLRATTSLGRTAASLAAPDEFAREHAGLVFVTSSTPARLSA